MTNEVVYKYELPAGPSQLWLPKNAVILHVHEQRNGVCLWVRRPVDAEDAERRKFWVVGTGHVLPAQDLRYHGTAHLAGGTLVLHVFEDDRRGE